jgi:hypothetical protein
MPRRFSGSAAAPTFSGLDADELASWCRNLAIRLVPQRKQGPVPSAANVESVAAPEPCPSDREMRRSNSVALGGPTRFDRAVGALNGTRTAQA